MGTLVGANRQWANAQYVALIDRAKVVRAPSLSELAQLLYSLGIDERDIRLAPPDDGDHAMSLKEHAQFGAAWLIAKRSGKA